MADQVILSGGPYGGQTIELAEFEKEDEIAPRGHIGVAEITEPHIVHMYRLTEDKKQAVFTGVKPG